MHLKAKARTSGFGVLVGGVGGAGWGVVGGSVGGWTPDVADLHGQRGASGTRGQHEDVHCTDFRRQALMRWHQASSPANKSMHVLPKWFIRQGPYHWLNACIDPSPFAELGVEAVVSRVFAHRPRAQTTKSIDSPRAGEDLGRSDGHRQGMPDLQ